ncbi:glycosyltransferase [Paraburkholderia bryophila]|uniref:Glycosyltransferase involved in cell wall biosynthesis n=1 Tax=Paraburkholderia bryophila TaxID=420952 RepID=A0A7Z0BCJ2_9BURK|nr:glycosyltransferase [Paraburkholderia bryophila]NYH27622.1 glycosyltransferase involved in cell wall biosynthesis [Paraburkholderia bryophila]
MTAANNVEQLLALDGRNFVRVAYVTLLGREPDDHGAEHYMHQLIKGISKARVLVDIGSSAEAVAHGAHLEGLDKLTRRGRLALSTLTYVKRMFRNDAEDKSSQRGVATIPGGPTSPEPETVKSAAKPMVRATKHRAIKTPAKSNGPQFWFDLTTSFEWTGGVVGIIRAELEIACGLKKADPNVRFSMQLANGFVEIPDSELQWLFNARNVADAYMRFFGRYPRDTQEGNTDAGTIEVNMPASGRLTHPYGPGDVVVSVGWMDSRKEAYFSRLKAAFPKVFITYLIYDVILLRPETRHFYAEEGQSKFENYIKWISEHADFTLFGGETAKRDTLELQTRMGWPTPPGAAIKFGSDIVKLTEETIEPKLLADMGITGQFIITVGSLEPRKNHDTLYKAYLMALATDWERTPQLVICGKPMWRVDDLVDSLNRDPRLTGKVIRLSPTDTQLAALYKHCAFTVLPSLYEGWSLTLPESLSQGKFCLATDTPPLREIGRDLIDYAPAWDVRTWADKILLYANDKTLLNQYERRIASEWPVTTWQATSQMVYDHVKAFAKTAVPSKRKPEIWMDLSLSFLHWQGGVNGIIRAELTFARYLDRIAPNTHFFAYDHGRVFEIRRDLLLWLFDDSDLSTSYRMFHDFWGKHEADRTGFRSPFAGGAPDTHPDIIESFPDNTIIFFAGIDWVTSGDQHRIKAAVRSRDAGEAILVSQLIYDFTPMLVPHLHAAETSLGYAPFVEYVSQTFDHIAYGGRTAQRDGIAIQKQHGWRTPASDFIEFGSDIDASRAIRTASDEEILTRLGVSKNFVMTVGTVEPRKNHETLYKAYVTLLTRGEIADLPQMLFIGKQGWKSNDFLSILNSDLRTKNRILIISPTDEELDVLYRHCRFTLLPSFYEGWSLTLPESLSYGKLCLTSDVEPLRETGRDLVDYIDPLDTFAWAEKIGYYVTHPKAVAQKETRIRREWKARSWLNSTHMLLDALYAAHEAKRVSSETELSGTGAASARVLTNN